MTGKLNLWCSSVYLQGSFTTISVSSRLLNNISVILWCSILSMKINTSSLYSIQRNACNDTMSTIILNTYCTCWNKHLHLTQRIPLCKEKFIQCKKYLQCKMKPCAVPITITYWIVIYNTLHFLQLNPYGLSNVLHSEYQVNRNISSPTYEVPAVGFLIL